MSEEELVELLPFLDPEGQRPDVTAVALQHVFGLTGSKDGLGLLKGCTKTTFLQLFRRLAALMSKCLLQSLEHIAKDASLGKKL